MSEISRLTDLEITIMNVLWEHEKAMTVQEISECLKEEKISLPSVNQAMKKLVIKKAVTVPEHILVSNVYARTFLPAFTQEEYMAAEMVRLQQNLFGKKKFSLPKVAAALFNNADNKAMKKEEIDELQKIIDAKKQNMEDA